MNVRDAREMTVETVPIVETCQNLMDLDGKRRHAYCVDV